MASKTGVSTSLSDAKIIQKIPRKKSCRLAIQFASRDQLIVTIILSKCQKCPRTQMSHQSCLTHIRHTITSKMKQQWIHSIKVGCVTREITDGGTSDSSRSSVPKQACTPSRFITAVLSE